ncbi:MAG: aminopeptidase P family protein, partial [Sedimentisphaerales bacterium]|nr:aminopeptidase P family protein [Sedimentisphaerales bacterium]
MNAEAMKRRLGNIRAQFRRQHVDAVLLTHPVNVTYVTGFSGDDSWALVAGNTVYLLTDSRYTEQARQECCRTRIVERKGSIAEAAGKLLGRLKSVSAVGIEQSMALGSYQAFKKHAGVRLKATDGLVAEFRSIKDEDEIEAIKAAAAVATTALARVEDYFKPGITESELAGVLDLEIRKRGCKNSFETIVAFGANASRPHHQPTQRKLRARDTILIDFGARYNGYCCDITRCFVIGKPTKAYRQAYGVVERAQAAAIETAQAGVALVAVDAAARDVIRRSGLPVYGHGSGHGLGLEIHETPFLKEQARGKLRAGQVITIEPGIYIPGELGVRIED